MGLIIWIPFVHGNCENQGTLNVETSVLGTVSYEDGKLGKAVKIGTGSQVSNGISINSNLVDELGDEYSCAVWIKPTGNHVHYEGAILSSGNWNRQRWAFGVNQTNSAVDMFGPGHSRNLSCEIPVDEWTHLVSTFKNNIGTLYKNGEQIGTYTFSNQSLDANGLQSDAINTTVGRETYAYGYFGFNGYIQDLRVFNHCLSDREAKEISQGKVLHYPLSMPGQKNLVLDSANKMASHLTSGNEYIAINLGQSYADIASGTQVTISFDLELKVGTLNNYFYIYNTNNKGPKQINGVNIGSQVYAGASVGDVVKKRMYAVTTIVDRDSPTQTNNFIEFYTTYNTGNVFKISKLKIEEGSTPTPWIPNPADAEYSALGFNNGIEYDISGYQHNGTKVGDITYDLDTPRYKTSTILDGTYISLESLIDAKISQFSVCGWVNLLTGYAVNNGCHLINFNKQYCRICISKDNVAVRVLLTNGATNYMGASTMTSSSLSANVWNHYAVTFDNGSVNIYINGELDSSKTATISYISPGTLWTIGNYTSERPKAKISDVRFYTTCLSATDIKDLYDKHNSTITS